MSLRDIFPAFFPPNSWDKQVNLLYILLMCIFLLLYSPRTKILSSRNFQSRVLSEDTLLSTQQILQRILLHVLQLFTQFSPWCSLVLPHQLISCCYTSRGIILSLFISWCCALAQILSLVDSGTLP